MIGGPESARCPCPSSRPAPWSATPPAPTGASGQVQSAIGTRVTVNFEHAGKQALDTRHVRLELVAAAPGEAGSSGQPGQAGEAADLATVLVSRP